MPQTVEIPGEGIAEFPDSMTPDEIKGVIDKKHFSQTPPLPEQVVHPQMGLGEMLFDPETAQNLRGAIQDVVYSIPGMIAQVPKMAFQGLKFAVGGPQERTQIGEEALTEAVAQGQQLAKDVQSPLGSRESFKGFANLGLMAAPAVGELVGEAALLGRTKPPIQTEVLPKGGEINAEQISTPAQVNGDVLNAARPEKSIGEVPANVGSEGVQTRGQGEEVQQAETVAPSVPQPEQPTVESPIVQEVNEGLADGEQPPSVPETPAIQAEEPQFEIPNPVPGSGKFRATYQVDKELGDRMEGIGASKESGSLRSEIASRKLLDDLTTEQEADLGKYLVSRRLKTLNPEHPQILSDTESARIESDPEIARALDTYRSEVKPEIESLRKQAGLSEEAAAGKEAEFISLIKKPVEETTGGKVQQASRLPRKTRFAKTAEGQASEYDTNLRDVLRESYTEVTRKARVAEFYKAVERKGLAEPSTFQTSKGPISKVQFDDLPPELQNQLRAATEQEVQPSGLADVGRKFQKFTTGIALTANPAELMNHMRRQLNLVSAKPPIGRGLISRLESVVPYIGPKAGTFARTVTDNMSKPENMAILQDIFDAGGGSSRSFKSMYESKIPGLRQLQSKTHELLFGIPKGTGVSGWDLRMRVQLEKIRRSAEGNTDPQRIREFANQIGQYGTHPDWIVKALRGINPYAATTLPMRLTELKTAIGKSDLKSGGGGKLGRTAETLLRGTGGTILGLASANYFLSGKWPWENDKGHEFDLNTGAKGEDGKAVYMKFRTIAPELARPVGTAALSQLSRETTAKHPQYLSAFLTGLANQGLSLVSGPAQNAFLTALTGKVPYVTKAPGQRPEVMDIAKTDKEGSRGLQQLKHAAAAINPLGTALVEEPYHTQGPGPLKYVEQPIPGVRPFGSVFTQAYEKKKSSKTKPRQGL